MSRSGASSSTSRMSSVPALSIACDGSELRLGRGPGGAALGRRPAQLLVLDGPLELVERAAEVVAHRRRGDVDLGADPHPITGSLRSAESASRVSCIRRMMWS